MESWHQKEYVSTDLVCDEELLARNRNLFVGWEMKVPEFGADTLMSEKGSDNVIEEVGYSEISGKPFLATSTSTRDYCFNKGCIREMVTPIQGFPKTLSVDDEFNSKFSSPFSESDCQNSAHTNLKLGRLADSRVSKSFKLFRGSSIVSSAESSTPVKRTRSAGLNSQTFFCQVHGCNKDLSSSKDYHKKHRVCDSHSKTAKVIVNGVEQRFCQQCSRFHLLAEFDEGKRSCRRRLACHNERRRKPHLGNHYGRSGKFQSYNGGRLNEISFSKTSSICEEIFVSDQLHLEKHGANGWNQHTRVKFENDYSNLFAVPEENGNLHPKNHLQAINLGKESSVCGSQADNLLKSVIRDTGDDYSHGLPRLQCSDRSYSFTSFGYQDSNVFCTKPNFNGFSTTTSPGVLSLLSSQSQNSSSYLTGIPTAQTSSITGNPAHCIVSQVSDTILEAFPIASVNGVSHKLPSCGLSSEMSNLHPILNPEDNIGVNFANSELFEGLTDDAGGLSCEDELTLDLLQLSSQLQRVEHQKQSMYAMPHP